MRHETRTDDEIKNVGQAGSAAKKTNGISLPIAPSYSKLICQHCFIDCKTEAEFETHIQTHVLDLHSCKICAYVSKNKVTVTDHIKRLHPREYEENSTNIDNLIERCNDDDESDESSEDDEEGG
jgi:hypothetical protein